MKCSGTPRGQGSLGGFHPGSSIHIVSSRGDSAIDRGKDAAERQPAPGFHYNAQEPQAQICVQYCPETLADQYPREANSVVPAPLAAVERHCFPLYESPLASL